MSRPSFRLGTKTIAAGSRRTVELPISLLSDHTPMTLSAHVIHGRADGPAMFVSGGVHGDEVIGAEIVRRLLKSPNMDGLRGTLIAVPVVNGFGLINHSRYLPNRRDLNRSFPGSEQGSLAARLADLFLTEIVARADLGVDLHSAAIHRSNYPQIRITRKDARSLELANVFGAPIIMESPLRDGSLRKAAATLGKPVLLFEAGEGLRFDELSVRAGVAGLLRVMRHLKMIAARGVAPVKAAPQLCVSSKWLRAPMGGLLRAYKENGSVVRKGETLAALSDPFGENEEEVVASFDGVIIGRAVMPVVNEGDAIFHLARTGSTASA